MFAIIGILVVFGAVIGGFLMEHGHLAVLVQPSELVTIGGAALGTIFIANPMEIIKAMASGVLGTLKPSPFNQARYLDTLKLLFELLSKARKKGLVGIEDDVEKPAESEIVARYPTFLADHHALHFVCDTLRTAITGGVEPFDMDQMMDLDMEIAHHEAMQPVAALTTVADSLPGLGIVAAVLGVVITMGALGGPPEEIGKKVAAALVGTFLGILMCYGLIGPIASNMTKQADAHNGYLHILRVVLLAFLKGLAPILAVEMGRRAIPEHLRPSFDAMEQACKGAAAAPTAADFAPVATTPASAEA
ncbi:MAG TPA: flagellar motor stator protein MotA [Acidobacteriaceae bacterium]|nr:flagellar motor stator protein MotA [Acidobacteriaceae bacterium]